MRDYLDDADTDAPQPTAPASTAPFWTPCLRSRSTRASSPIAWPTASASTIGPRDRRALHSARVPLGRLSLPRRLQLDARAARFGGRSRSALRRNALPCFPRRTCSISSCTNSPACVVAIPRVWPSARALHRRLPGHGAPLRGADANREQGADGKKEQRGSAGGQGGGCRQRFRKIASAWMRPEGHLDIARTRTQFFMSRVCCQRDLRVLGAVWLNALELTGAPRLDELWPVALEPKAMAAAGDHVAAHAQLGLRTCTSRMNVRTPS